MNEYLERIYGRGYDLDKLADVLTAGLGDFDELCGGCGEQSNECTCTCERCGEWSCEECGTWCKCKSPDYPEPDYDEIQTRREELPYTSRGV